jgi:hypothetical protein
MRINDFVAVRFPKDPKTYYAQVTGFTRAGAFECRFVHSGAVYRFMQKPDFLEVIASAGAFKPGTIVGEAMIYTEDGAARTAPGVPLAVTFDDGKSYLAVVEKAAPLTVRFLHSGNVYSFDEQQIAHKRGGTYDGRKALAMRPYREGRSLFSPHKDVHFALAIKDEFGNPLRGEFEVRLQQSNPAADILVNPGLSAENSTAEATFRIAALENQRLTLFLDFHPAVHPFVSNPVQSSEIDRLTTISSTSSFQYDPKVRALNCDVVLTYDRTTVTATTMAEAINTVFNQVTQSSSHSAAIKLEGEAGITLFGVGGKLSGGGTTTDTHTSGTIGGSTSGTVSGGSNSTSWTVHYPQALQLNVTQSR